MSNVRKVLMFWQLRTTSIASASFLCIRFDVSSKPKVNINFFYSLAFFDLWSRLDPGFFLE